MSAEEKEKKKHRTSQQRLGVVLCGLLLGFGIASPAQAYLSKVATDIQPWLSSVGVNIEPYIEDLKAIESYYSRIINAENLDDVLTGLRWSLGKMGLPIAGQIPDEIQNAVGKVTADAGTYTVSSQKLEKTLLSEANKKYADAQVKILLGQEGQQEIYDSLENNAKIVAASLDSARRIQGMTVSQRILQEHSRIEANNSTLLGSIYEELVLSRINNTWNNQNSAVLAADVQQKNWSEEVTKTSEQAYIMRATAQAFSYGLNSNTTAAFP